jgi:hypothetical protein
MRAERTSSFNGKPKATAWPIRSRLRLAVKQVELRPLDRVGRLPRPFSKTSDIAFVNRYLPTNLARGGLVFGVFSRIVFKSIG